MDIDELKVAELRAELQSRGLDTKGTKPILVQRLKEFIEANPEAAADESMAAADESTAEEPAAAADAEEATEDTPAAEQAAEDTNGDESALQADAKTPAKEAKEGEAKTPGTDKKRGQKRNAKKAFDDEPFVVTENEPEIGETVVCLDWYDSDLSMRIDKEEHMSGEPFNREGWGYVWSGARATHGYTAGKVWYEVKLVENLDTKVDESEKRIHELRVGWSTNDTSLQLGEADNSFAYAGNGMAATGNSFDEYAETFAKGDVVGAYVDLSADPVNFHFTKNGEDQGVAFSIPKSQLGDQALFPHISSRNVKFEANFGKNKAGEAREPAHAAMEGYTWVADSEGVKNTPRIEKRDECEMVMLIGLPGCGKTTWVNKFIGENPDKKYDVIGTATLIEKMKVDGEPKKKHLEGKWDQLIQKSTRCLQDLLRTASQRRRNVIIDQTNVYPNAQKRKVRPFEGMTRKAVVIVPSEEDYKARTEAQKKEESNDVPDNAVMEMKANFGLPAESKEGEESPFKEIIFVELQREEAAKLIEGYNKDAKEKGFGKSQNPNKKKKPNPQAGGRGRGRGAMRGGFPPMRGMMMRGGGGGGRGGPMGFAAAMRGGMRGMPMRGGPMGGPMRGGPMMGGPMMGGPMGRGGPMGGGPMRAGGAYLGGTGRGGMQRGGFKQQQMNKQQGGGRGGNRGGNNQRGGQRGNKMGGGGPQNKFNKMQNQMGGMNAWGGNMNQGMMQQQGGWGGGMNQGGGMQNPWGGNQGMQQGMQQMNMMNQGMGGGNQWGNNQMGGRQQGNQWGNNQMGGRQQGNQWGGNQGGGYPGSQNWGGYGR